MGDDQNRKQLKESDLLNAGDDSNGSSSGELFFRAASDGRCSVSHNMVKGLVYDAILFGKWMANISTRKKRKLKLRKRFLLSRELLGLRFDNPGNAVALAEDSLLTQMDSGGLRRSTRKHYQPGTSSSNNEKRQQKYRPHHDRDGLFVKPDGTKVKLCDCLRTNCSGCHWPCGDCGSKMCGPECQKGREYVPTQIGCKHNPQPVIYHPFLPRGKEVHCPCTIEVHYDD